jgi:hypothetical protein
LCALHGQEQEGKLVDRLLRPNTSLGSSEQNKKFTADRVSVDKSARVSTFYLQRKPDSKTYSNTHDYQAGQFKADAFDSAGSGNSLLAARSTVPTGSYATPAARASAELRDGHKHVGGNDFAGNRPFLDKGKSQKSLDHKNAPMTIDQVRELLNKNK